MSDSFSVLICVICLIVGGIIGSGVGSGMVKSDVVNFGAVSVGSGGNQKLYTCTVKAR